MSATGTAETPAPMPLLDIETALLEMRGLIATLGYIINKAEEPADAALHVVQTGLQRIHADLTAQWQRVWRETYAERVAYAEALEAANARKAAPGSPADLEHARGLWALLRSAAKVAADACDKALPPGAASRKVPAKRKAGRRRP